MKTLPAILLTVLLLCALGYGLYVFSPWWSQVTSETCHIFDATTASAEM
ncbi:MAG: hypothetical protein KGZ92_03495 [Firmicutes bacterium]|nr:hypothetical protein [Dethiobacter sp.]MBS3888354.1 hypothetical protein [Bacillota bacterium]